MWTRSAGRFVAQICAESVSLKITDAIRKEIYAEIEKWAGADYKLIVNNCVDFSLAIAKMAGFRIPDRNIATVPTEFVEGLKKNYWAGTWSSSDPGARFKLVINEPNVEWSELNPETHQTIKKTVPLKQDNNGAWRIARENSADVLQGLGYNSSIIPAIVAASPQPSFIKMSRVGPAISGEWNGLIVIKDNQGRFSSLKQPGTFPSKHFDFLRTP